MSTAIQNDNKTTFVDQSSLTLLYGRLERRSKKLLIAHGNLQIVL